MVLGLKLGRVLAAIASVGVALSLAAATRADTILFVGNSFTYGAGSPVMQYRAGSVSDLNGEGIGGVPALFKRFTEEAGLDYRVSLVTHPGVGLDYHWANNLAKIDRPWDHVVLQSFSTLDAAHPGDPALLIDYVRRFAERLKARNPGVDIWLDATWSRPDQTYPERGAWHGKPIFDMAEDLQRGYEQAAAAAPGVHGVVDVGAAFNRAIRAGVADPNPYDGITPGQLDLWTTDNYHASTAGYYLEALMIFGRLTGRDPRTLGDQEAAAADLGLTSVQANALQQVASDELQADRARAP
jgi:hypothetical protein